MKKCVVIGAGNVARALAPALEKTGWYVAQVWSRDMRHAASLASRLRCAEPTDDTGALDRDAGLYVVAVRDNAIAEIAQAMSGTGGLWVHTCGATDESVLRAASPTCGSLYPLQTFTRDREVDLSGVPFLISAPDADTLARIRQIAEALSGKVTVTDAGKRMRIHAAAVFACNFANRMWVHADNILRDAGEDLTLLKPLIEETVRKAMAMPPAQAQTGPAVRGDSASMERHRSVLTPGQREIYDAVSADIARSAGEK